MVVVGSGAAGLTAALVAASKGATVVVLERSQQLGGTAAVSGGMLWIPNSRHAAASEVPDTRGDALAYLRALGLGRVAPELQEAFVDRAPEMLDFLEQATPARFLAVDRPDYRPDLPGSRAGGRSLDNLPFSTAHLADTPLRAGFAVPIVHEERRRLRRAAGVESVDRREIERRAAAGERTLGGALAGALLTACLAVGVTFLTGRRVRELRTERSRVTGVVAAGAEGDAVVRARRGVVLASGGFEWNDAMKRAFLASPECVPISPPYNEGDGIALGLTVGARLDNMTEAWWVPSFRIPGEFDDGRPKARHISDELALPGSIVVNRFGERFVNEATNYSDLSRSFAYFDSTRYTHPNIPAWLVFDAAFKRRYIAATVQPDEPAPSWWATGPDLDGLAAAAGIDAGGLSRTVSIFNAAAEAGVDSRFHRGENIHDRYYGDEDVGPNPCLAPLAEPPFYALEIRPGAFGTKGGLAVGAGGRVLRGDGTVVDGLYAAGNTSAGVMGPGYAGAGATLGSALTFGYIAGLELR